MAEYYRNDYGSARRRRKRSVAGVVADGLMAAVTLVLAAVFVLTLLVPLIDPYESGELSTVGLVAPFVYAAQLLLTLYWIIRWRWAAMVPMIVLSVVGLFHLSLFYKPEIRRSYGEQTCERTAVKVLTYNVRSFIDDHGARCLDSVAGLVKALNPDIVCFQEMGFVDLADSLLRPLNPLPRSLSRAALSPAIYSRYPVVRARRIDTMMNFVWADLRIGDDTVRVFNNHLHTTAIRRDDNTYIENREFLGDEDMGKLRSMVSRLSENNKLRAAQADSVARMIAESPYPVIVCGDFNDTPVSYTYRTVSRGLKDAFREAGRGYSHTYRGFFDMLRIDYVLCSYEFEPLSYEVIDSWGLADVKRGKDTVTVRRFGNGMDPPTDAAGAEVDNGVRYSDHYPVFVRLRYNGR